MLPQGGKRTCSRVSLEFPVAITAESGEHFPGILQNLGLGGVFVACDTSLSVGTACQILLVLGDMDRGEQIRFYGHVVRKESHGLAIAFTKIDTDGFTHLKNLLCYNAPNPDEITEEFRRFLGIKAREAPLRSDPGVAPTIAGEGALIESNVFKEEDIQSLIAGVWETVLGLAARPVPAPPVGVQQGLVAGCVQISGDWEGAVLLELPTLLACHVACIMFDLDPACVSSNEIRDAVAELTNIAGGNLKALIPGICSLALPEVGFGSAQHLPMQGRLIAEMTFESEGMPFVVRILERLRTQALTGGF
jgi:CheY-specific phosphatase CheX